jgi:hypothetical protein
MPTTFTEAVEIGDALSVAHDVTVGGGAVVLASDGYVALGNGFVVPGAKLAYQAAPTAESLRDALIAAGYMDAGE